MTTEERQLLERRLAVTQQQLMNAMARIAELEALILISQESDVTP